MPELPEVEITRRGLAAALSGQRITRVVIRNAALRWPIPQQLPVVLVGKTIREVRRRAKYLLLDCGDGALILHLGMTGSLRILPAACVAAAHDHFDLVVENGVMMRLRDPRRFGAVLWQDGGRGDRRDDDALAHPLLAGLGPEPLSDQFNGAVLYKATRGRTASIKALLLDSHIVAGVGNIYANEALYAAAIRPSTPAGRLSRPRCERLAIAVKQTLEAALAAGGSSLRDYVASDGEPGCFQLQYAVYGRATLPCLHCSSPVRALRIGQRSTFYCVRCQR
ncbi:MAG: bifunctional DNA-formamidopyrimidine glycosylase/DNA-(apurinic or apyrimidinic site) lyase [Burkholderiales bacterium]|nr:bifunctional DNA-formamidopyrimidine glycosylase/DNA-(apurinic or apyrimidinic site) lyase [Burkholderiales bacterium]